MRRCTRGHRRNHRGQGSRQLRRRRRASRGRADDGGVDRRRGHPQRRPGQLQPDGPRCRPLPPHRARSRIPRSAPCRECHSRHAGDRRRCAAGRAAVGRGHGVRLASERRDHAGRPSTGQRDRFPGHRRSCQDCRRTGGRGRGWRGAPADEPDDGRRVRARADGQQGERVRRRCPLLEWRAARRREHLPGSDRARHARVDRSAARTLERAVRQRCPGREHSVLLASARRRHSGGFALAHQPERRRRLGSSIRRRLGSCRLYRAVPWSDGLAEWPSSRGDSHGERHRFARGRHAVSGSQFRRVDGRSASRHRVPPGGWHRAVELDSESEHQPRRLLHAHGPGRRRALRPAAGRRWQPDLRPQRSVPRSGLGAPRAAPPRAVCARLVHVFVQQPVRRAREPGRQRQSDGNDRPRARTDLRPRPAGVAHQRAFIARAPCLSAAT